MRTRSWVVVGAVGLAGCGIDVTGSAGADSSGDAGTAAAAAPEAGGAGDGATDGSIDAPEEPGPPVPCPSTGTACSGAVPLGWKLLALAGAPGSACPSNFKQRDLVTAAAALPGACTCACVADAADPPTCAKGSFTGGVGAGCTTTGVTFTVDGTGCLPAPAGVAVQPVASMGPLPFHAGKCNASVRKDATQLSSQGARVCDPPPSCAEDVCLGNVPPGFAGCIAHDGELACPGAPFNNRSVLGTAPNVTCGGCATCLNAGTCGTATFRYYNDSVCATELASRIADGNCNSLATGTAGAPASHFRYDVTATALSCIATSTATAAVGLDAPTTVCCR